MSDAALTAALALLAAFLFALGVQFLNRGLAHADPQTGSMIDIGASAALHWLLAPFLLVEIAWDSPGIWIFAAIGLFRPLLSANLSLQGVRFLGPTLASTFATTTPLFGLAIGVVLLGEEVTPLIGLGTVAIMGGMMALAPRGKRREDWPLWALGLPLGAAFLRSMGHGMTKFGLLFAASPFLAGITAYTVSFALAVAAQLLRRDRPRISWRRPGLLWFVAAGLANATAVFTMNNALLRGEVVVVVPIVSAYPFFTLLLSLAVFRAERLSARTLLAMLLVLPGVALIAVAR